MAAVRDGNAGHRLGQRRGRELAVLEHFEARRNLRNDDLVDAVARHASLCENLIRDVLDDRVARNGDVLAREGFGVDRIFGRARDELVAAVRIRRDLDVETAVLCKGDGQHVGNVAVERAALERRITIHRALELLELDVEALFLEIALFLRNDERQGVHIRHQADRELRERFGFLGLRGAAGGENEGGEDGQDQDKKFLQRKFLLIIGRAGSLASARPSWRTTRRRRWFRGFRRRLSVLFRGRRWRLA